MGAGGLLVPRLPWLHAFKGEVGVVELLLLPQQRALLSRWCFVWGPVWLEIFLGTLSEGERRASERNEADMVPQKSRADGTDFSFIFSLHIHFS